MLRRRYRPKDQRILLPDDVPMQVELCRRPQAVLRHRLGVIALLAQVSLRICMGLPPKIVVRAGVVCKLLCTSESRDRCRGGWDAARSLCGTTSL